MFFKFDFIPYIGITIKKEKKLTMDMRVFQIESGRVLPMKGDILISSPFFRGHDLTRSVVLLLEHNEEGSMGIILNKEFRKHI